MVTLQDKRSSKFLARWNAMLREKSSASELREAGTQTWDRGGRQRESTRQVVTLRARNRAKVTFRS